MNVLILSCGTGGGHNDAARGVAEALQARGHKADLRGDYLRMAGQGVENAVCGGYVELVRRQPGAFRALYGVGQGVSTVLHKARVPSPVYWANAAMAGHLARLLASQRYDAVVMPHLFPAETVTRMKRRGYALPLTVAVATDHTSIPFWEETGCDFYIVPDKTAAADFVRRGVPEEKLVPLGIPAPAAYTTDFDRAAVRRALGFAPEGKYILVMGGSMGAGDLPALLRQVRAGMGPDARLLVLTGSNRRLHDALLREYAGDRAVAVLDRVANAAPYMQACDLLFTKPGGLSSTECVLSRVPTVLLEPLSQCEVANRDRLVACRCALAPATVDAQAKWGLRLLRDEAAAAAMRRAQAACLPENPAGPLVRWLERQTERTETT